MEDKEVPSMREQERSSLGNVGTSGGIPVLVE